MTSKKTRLVRSTLAGAVLATAVTGLFGAPAQAAPQWQLVDRDGVSIDGGHSDFGNDPHLFGSPFPDSGTVEFSVKEGVVRAVVSGRTYLDDLPGQTARTVVRFEKADGSLLASRVGGRIARSTGGLHQTGVWSERLTDPRIARVTIRTELSNAGGGFRLTGSKTVRMDAV